MGKIPNKSNFAYCACKCMVGKMEKKQGKSSECIRIRSDRHSFGSVDPDPEGMKLRVKQRLTNKLSGFFLLEISLNLKK